MTCRSLLWIAAPAVALSAAVAHPSVDVAELGGGWAITIDEPTADAVIESKHLTIEGTASHDAGIDAVTVTLAPQGLPPHCDPATGPATVQGNRYLIELDVACNGPYQINIDAEGPSGSATGEPQTIGVAERPPQPAPPAVDVTGEGGLRATWSPGEDPDSTGSILHVNFRQVTYPRGIKEAILPPADRRAAVSVRTLRWGAGGPGTTITSPESGGTYIAEIKPTEPTDPPPDPEPPTNPGPEPSAQIPPPHGPTRPTNSPPRATIGTTTEPAAPPTDTTTATVAGWLMPDRQASPGPETRRAVSTAAPGAGMVRTTDDRTSGRGAPLVVSFALAPLTALAILIWLRHRRTPREGGVTRRLQPGGISSR